MQKQETIDKSIIILSLLAATLFAIVFYPSIKKLVAIWSTSEEYNHAFLTIPVIFYMIWTKRELLTPSNKISSITGFLLVGLSLITYYFALLTQVNTIIFMSMFMAILGITVCLFDFKALKNILAPLFLMLMLIPIPDQLYIKITFPLQIKVSQVSEFIVRLFDVPILRQGNVMNIPNKSFEVVEACSGLRSMITLITLSVIVGFFMLKKYLSKLILIFTSIPIAVLINVIRVSMMILMFHFFKIDLSVGTLHDITGIFLFIVALFTLLGIQKVFEIWENR